MLLNSATSFFLWLFRNDEINCHTFQTVAKVLNKKGKNVSEFSKSTSQSTKTCDNKRKYKTKSYVKNLHIWKSKIQMLKRYSSYANDKYYLVYFVATFYFIRTRFFVFACKLTLQLSVASTILRIRIFVIWLLEFVEFFTIFVACICGVGLYSYLNWINAITFNSKQYCRAFCNTFYAMKGMLYYN